MRDKTTIELLTAAFPDIGSAKLLPVVNVIERIRQGVDASYYKNSLLSAGAFDYLTSFILTFHSFSRHPLKKENFERALEDAYKKEGKVVLEMGDPTLRGADLVADGLRFSLKTYSSNTNQFPDKFDISKFAESRWLREPLRDEDFPEILRQLKEAVKSHLKEYDKILLLVNNESGSEAEPFIEYRLYEVPKSILMLATKLSVVELSKCYLTEKAKRVERSKAMPQTVSADLLSAGEVVGKVSLDGSVEKIRFLGVGLTACSLIGEWHLSV